MDNNNKYIFDLDSLDTVESEDKILARRKKHKKGRVLSWVFLLVFVCIFVTAAAFGISFLVKKLAPKTSVSDSSVPVASVSHEIEVNDVIDELLNKEDDLVIAPPEPVVTEPTEEELLEAAIEEFIAKMTLEEKVSGVFLVTPEQLTGVANVTRAGDGTKTAIEKYPVGGIIYSSKNMTSPSQFKEIIDNTKSYAKFPLFLALDEELGFSSMSSAMKAPSTKKASELGADNDSSLVYLEEEKIAMTMSEYGLNLNLGVTADVLYEGEESAYSEHIFGSSPDLCGAFAAKQIAALNEYGVSASVKCFPGQGSLSVDTSSGLSVSNISKDDFEKTELASFITAVESGAQMIMVGHCSMPNIVGDNTQCSQSKAIMTELLRVNLGYDDLIIITDALSKSAISSYLESGDACIAAIKAGADMVLSPENFTESYDAVLEAVNKGVIAKERIDDSLKRIYKVKFAGMSVEEITSFGTLSE